MRNRAFNFPVYSWILKLALINFLFILCHKCQVWKDFTVLLDLSLSNCMVVRSLPTVTSKRAADAGVWCTADNINQLRPMELCCFLPAQDEMTMVDSWCYLHVGEAQPLSPRLQCRSLISFFFKKKKKLKLPEWWSISPHPPPSFLAVACCESAKV